MGGFLAPLFWLGLSASPYAYTSTGAQLCATVAMYPSMGAAVQVSPAMTSVVDITPAMDAAPEFRNC